MSVVQSKIIKDILLKYLKKKFRSLAKQRDFLIDCIQSSGYIEEKVFLSNEESENEEEYEDLYAHFMPGANVSKKKENTNNPEMKVSLKEQEQSSVDPYGFNRTFIHADSRHGDKLAEIQKRGITYEETEFNKVKEQMEYLIEVSLHGNTDAPIDKILQTALNMYLNIMIYYAGTSIPKSERGEQTEFEGNVYKLNEMKGSLKKGYIFMCVYYSLIHNGYYIDRATIMEQSEKIRFRDLPQAEKNIKLIFNGVSGYQFLNKSYHGTWNPNGVFSKTTNFEPKEFKKLVERVIEETKSFVPSTKLGMYSLLYFICNQYLTYKIKIMYNEVETRVTYKVLDNIFGSYGNPTIRKITDQLLRFYKR